VSYGFRHVVIVLKLLKSTDSEDDFAATAGRASGRGFVDNCHRIADTVNYSIRRFHNSTMAQCVLKIAQREVFAGATEFR
jgi:hypothetical protein